MYVFLMIIHIIVCLVLISVILLQAGKGAGLSGLMGGSNPMQGILGTKAADFMTKATAFCAILFLCTCSLLIIVSKNRSISKVAKYASKTEQAAVKPVSANTEPVQNTAK